MKPGSSDHQRTPNLMKTCFHRLLIAALLHTSTAQAVIDLDGDSLGDVWEQFYNATTLTAGGDADGDGISNLNESRAGTNPFSSTSIFAARSYTQTGGTAHLVFPSLAGKVYVVQTSTDLQGWTNAGSSFTGTGGDVQVTLHGMTGSVRFFQAVCSDTDSDGDTLTDWEELTAQFNPNAAQTTTGVADAVALTTALSATSSTLTVSAPDGRAYERSTVSGTPDAARIRITRTGALTPVTVFYTTSGRPAVTTDYTAALPGYVTLGFGVNVADITLTPVADAALEVPETLTLTLASSVDYTLGGTTSAAVRFDDDETQTETMYFCTLGPQGAVTTNASGYSTIFLSGDHSSARVSVFFSGMTSPQTAAHVHLSDNTDIVESLELGQVQNHEWVFPVNGTGTLTSDQAILDALVQNRLYVNVHSDDNLSGEIRGDYRLTEGSINFTPPADPPPVPTYTGTALTTDLQRFIAQATMGQTDGLFSEVQSAGISAWMSAQMNATTTPSLSLLAFAKTADDWLVANALAAGQTDFEPRLQNLHYGWWTNTMSGRDQLRQRIALALSEIFVVSTNNTTVRLRHYGTADYYDMLARNAFGSFRTLLEEVTLHPIMASYLSMLKNEKYDPATGASPDENYAREIMQLFSIGLVDLHPDGTLRLDATSGQPIGTYDNNDITELAKVFTGWSFSKQQTGGAPFANQWNNDGTITDNNNFNAGGGATYAWAPFVYPLRMFPSRHETSAKTIVGGVTIPANQTGEDDLDDALDTLFNHPNTGPFIARRLIQRLVTSNPSRGYVYRVAQKFADDGMSVRGNLGAVVTAILTDYEARTQDILDQSGYGKMREPLLRFTHLLRAFGASTGVNVSVLADTAVTGALPAGARIMTLSSNATPNSGLVSQIGYAAVTQGVLAAPSVFNYFQPDYTFPGDLADAGLFAPEFQTATETNVVYLANMFSAGLWDVNGANRPGFNGATIPGVTSANARITLSYSAATSSLTSGSTSGLLSYLNGLLCNSALTATTQSEIADAVNNTATITGSSQNTERVKTALYLLLNSPDYAIQR